MLPRTLARVAAAHARERGDSVALYCADRSISFATLHRLSTRLAHRLRELGPGARIGCLARDSEFTYALLLACAQSGAVLVPVNWRLTGAEVAHILADAQCAALFVEAEFVGLAERAAGPGCAVVALDADGVAGGGLVAWSAGAGETEPPDPGSPDTPLVQIYTSGTTGAPKGVVLAQRSFFAVRDLLAAHDLDWIDWRDGDVNLVAVPGFHVGGLWWTLQAFLAGVPSVLLRAFVSSDALAAVVRHRVSTACMVPAMVDLLLREPGATSEALASLRKIVYGGCPVAPTLVQRCLDRMDCALVQIYGLTETGNTAVCLPPADHVAPGGRLAAAGRPYPGVSIRVVDESDAPVPAGMVGEVLVHTPARMVEYWRSPDATAATVVDGWVRTGDAGYLDADGYLYICDRIKDAVIVAGENVYPAEVEAALQRHPDVTDAAVVGVPDDRWGEAVLAFVVRGSASSLTARALALFLRDHLADFKRPTRYEFVAELPRGASGKVLRRVLREPYWRGRARQVN